jgi:hypothetical protein
LLCLRFSFFSFSSSQKRALLHQSFPSLQVFLLSSLQLTRDLTIQTSGIDMETATVVSPAVDPIDLVPYPQQGSSFNFVQSSVRQSSDIRQDTEFARLVERVKNDFENKELESAKERIAQSPLSFRNTFDIQVQSLFEHLFMSLL